MPESRRRRHGPAPLDPTVKRDHCVSVRLNGDELAWLDAARSAVRMQRGEYLRAAAMDKLPPTIPELNREAWVSLSRAASNLNQLAKAVNQSGFSDSDFQPIQSALADFRKSLIGADDERDAED